MREVKTVYITNGSSAVAPEIITREEHEERLRREKKERQRNLKKRRQANQIAMNRNRLSALSLMFCVVISGAFFFFYIHLQSGIHESMENISSLENELADIKASNAASERRIATTTNLTDIRKKAINKMGMHYAGADQIVYYDVDSSDYMVVYEQVP